MTPEQADITTAEGRAARLRAALASVQPEQTERPRTARVRQNPSNADVSALLARFLPPSSGGSAFPYDVAHVQDDGTITHLWAPGMTLADMFALAAMPVLVRAQVDKLRCADESGAKGMALGVAGLAYLIADAMIAEKQCRG